MHTKKSRQAAAWLLPFLLFGLAATLECPLHCKDEACDAQTGTCLHGCADGYYSGGSYCLDCPPKCRSCRSAGHCDLCETGFYGAICKYSSHLCIDNQCEKNGCTTGCIEGYFTKNVRSFLDDGIKYTACQVCPPNCISCNSSHHCTRCVEGYSGLACTCKNCHDTVAPSTAVPTPTATVPSSTIPTCDDISFVSSNGQCVPCPSNCLSCISDSQCTKCKYDYNGLICSDFNCKSISNCEKCICLSKNCHRHNHICTHCRDGFHGLRCESHCNPNCGQDAACDIEGHCIHGCKPGYWGVFCSQRCSIGCLNGVCHETTGHCQCKHGYNVHNYGGPMCELVTTDDKGNKPIQGVTSRPGWTLSTYIILAAFMIYILLKLV